MRKNNVTKITIFLILIFASALICVGQKSNSPLCDEVESKMIEVFKPTRTAYNIYLENDCLFYLYFNNQNRIFISVERYKSQTESSENIERSLGIFTAEDDENRPPKYRYKSINKDNYWDQAILYKDDGQDHFMLLRYRNYAIHVLSPNFRLLKKTEKVLREIKLN